MNVQSGEMKAVWVGHATVLVQAGGLNILTDPIWSDYASPFLPLGPERVTKPGIRFEDLPKIDLVVVRHNHYEHMDLPTLKRSWARNRKLIGTRRGNDSIITQLGAQTDALDWGQSVGVRPGVRVGVSRNNP